MSLKKSCIKWTFWLTGCLGALVLWFLPAAPAWAQDVKMLRARVSVYEEAVRDEAARLSDALNKKLESAEKAETIRSMAVMGALANEEAIVAGLLDKDPGVRAAALEAVRSLRFFSGMKQLASIALKGPDSEAVLALAALVRLGDERARKAVTKVLTRRRERAVRKAALAAVGRLGDPKAIPPLLKLLADTDLESIRLVADALARIGDPAAVEPLFRKMAALWREKGGEFPESWRDSLLAFMDKERASKLLEATTHLEPSIRALAMELLGELRHESCLKAATDLLLDPDGVTRRAAVLALGKLGGEPAGQALASYLSELDSLPDALLQGPTPGVVVTANRDENSQPMPQQYQEVGGGAPRQQRLATIARGERSAQTLLEFRRHILIGLARAGGEEALSAVSAGLTKEGLEQTALEALVMLSDPGGCDVAASALKSQSTSVRLSALEACVTVCTRLPPERFKEIFYELGDKLTPAMALEMTAKLGDPGLIDGLKVRYGAMKAPERLRYIDLVARTLGPQAGPFLLAATRRSADVGELQALTQGMCTAKARKEAEAAIKVIGKKGEIVAVAYDRNDQSGSPLHGCLGKLLLPRKRQSLSKTVRGREPWLQIAAMRVLAAGAARGADKLADKLLASSEPEVRKAALRALAVLGDEKAYGKAMSTALRDPNLTVRKAAVFGAVTALGEKATARLVGLLSNPELSVAVVDAMGQLRTSAMQLMFRFFNAGLEEQLHILAALGEVGDPVAAELLAPLTLRSVPRIKEAAARSLARLSATLSIAYLENLLRDDDPAVRTLAARTLGAMKARGAARDLLDLLVDESDEVRSASALALGNIGAQQAVDKLVPLLRHPTQSVRLAAAQALRTLGARESGEALDWMQRQHRHRAGATVRP